jgi:G3E family GTPase
MRVGFITNDRSENLVDTIIVGQMLTDLGVPVEEADTIVLNKVDLMTIEESNRPVTGGEKFDKLSRGTLIISARVSLEPANLETIVRDSLSKVGSEMAIQSEIDDLQYFSPAYPDPPLLIRQTIE